MTNTHRSHLRNMFRSIGLSVGYIHMLDGDIAAAAFLSQLDYWSDGRTRNEEGWIYKKQEEWREELGLSRTQVDRVVRLLREAGLIETRLKKANGAPTMHYRIVSEKLDWALGQLVADENFRVVVNPKRASRSAENLRCGKSAVGSVGNQRLETQETNDSLTETTTETSTDIYKDERILMNGDYGDPPAYMHPLLRISGLMPYPASPVDPKPGNSKAENIPPAEICEGSPVIIPAANASGDVGEVSAQSGCDEKSVKICEGSQLDVRQTPPDDMPDDLHREADAFIAELEARKAQATPSPAPPRTAEEHKRRIQAALDKFEANSAARVSEYVKLGIPEHSARKIIDYLAQVPEEVRPLAEAFCRGFGRAPMRGEQKTWLADFRALADLNIDGDDIYRACVELKKAEMTISAPKSVRATAEKHAWKRNKQTARAEVQAEEEIHVTPKRYREIQDIIARGEYVLPGKYIPDRKGVFLNAQGHFEDEEGRLVDGTH